MNETDLLLHFPYRLAPPLLVDVGAHVGGVARHFIARGWRAICIEPETANFNELRNEFGANPRVKLHKVAVGDKSEQRQFYTSPEHWGIHSLEPWHATHRQTETVKLTLLAYLVYVPVALLKIDIEGNELPALKGYDLKKFPPELAMVEFCDERTTQHFGYDHHDIVKYMAGYGYTAYVSEWEAVKEYSRRGKTAIHKHKGIKKYPLDHAPAWGNLLFVKQDRASELEALL